MKHILYIDVDGTLIDYNDEINEPLVVAIKAFLEEQVDWELVVWSGGGDKYARRWAYRIPGLPEPVMCLDKYDAWKHVEAECICVDDMELDVPCVVYTPEEFVHIYGAETKPLW